MSKLSVLVGDGDERLRLLFKHALSSEGHAVETAADASRVRDLVRQVHFDMVMLDIPGSPHDNAAVLRWIKETSPSTIVVALSAAPSVEGVIAAFQCGAFDFLIKPVRASRVRELAENIVNIRDRGKARSNLREQLEKEKNRVGELQKKLGSSDPFEKIIGSSAMMRNLVETVRELARTDSTVLITGESGTGKGLVARTIHEASERRDGPFIEANCVVYSEGVLHSELFGHVKGAFTGAIHRKKGRFEMARSGTIFLDEIGEIPPGIQVLLLRVLQDRTFELVGGEETIESDARLIAATNRDLEEAMLRGAFRKDLFFRLNVIPVHLPALREHPEDIPALAQHFLMHWSRKTGRSIERFSPAAIDVLTAHSWPGNVRELENAVERTVVLSKGDIIDLDDLPPALRTADREATAPVRGTLEEMERIRILEALRESSGNKKEAARRLGIHRSTLYTKMRRYGIDSSGESAA